MSLSPELQSLLKDAKNKYSRSGGRAIKLKEGKTRIRILPGKTSAKFWQDLGVHWIKTEVNGKPVSVVGCADHVHDKPCAVCAAVERASRSASDDESLALIKDWKAKRSVLVNAIIRSGPDAGENPQVLELTPTTFGTILSMMEEYAADYGDVTDLNKGTDFIIERKGKGLNTEYVVIPAPKSDPVPRGTMDKASDLLEFIEKEFFKGEEKKAIGYIANMTGISTEAAMLGSTPKGGILTGPSGRVDDARVADDDLPFDAPISRKPDTSAVSADDVDDILAELNNIS